MNSFSRLMILIPSATALPAVAEVKPEASAAVVAAVKEWVHAARDKRTEIPAAVAAAALTKTAAAEVTKLLWEDHVAGIKAERAAEMKTKSVTMGDKTMKFEILKFGDKPGKQPLFISMHGGGGTTAAANESQWENQIKLGQAYKPAAGLYLAPRAPTNAWNMWHEGHIDGFFDRIIENLIVLDNVDPDKVYLMGYSAGGDGVYELAPRLADRLAAASMMAGHPNQTSPLGLRNIGFTIHVGAMDGGYGRNKAAEKFGKQLDDLQKADPKGYVHFTKLHEGRPHWMNLEDQEAIPWMEKFTRNPLPDKVVWHQSGRTHDRFYWIAIPTADAKAGQEIVAERSGQKFTITAKSNPHVTVLLSDALADLDQPVTITLNGTDLPPRTPSRTLAVIRRTLEERGDPNLVFSAELSAP